MKHTWINVDASYEYQAGQIAFALHRGSHDPERTPGAAEAGLHRNGQLAIACIPEDGDPP